mmetsp:Transcript_4948/g.8681  ORF Transcript_4948/g.8681 Transcript_4948/m.8681 type:complete len:82 (+) Transcript_4948:3-248(+)
MERLQKHEAKSATLVERIVTSLGDLKDEITLTQVPEPTPELTPDAATRGGSYPSLSSETSKPMDINVVRSRRSDGEAISSI